MAQFRREDRARFGGRDSGGSGRRFHARGSFGSGERSERRDFGRANRNSEQEMHHAICDKCGRDCEVPFRPSGGKPVYCNDCFRKNDNFEPKGRISQSSEELAEINMKLDKILKALNID